MVFFLKMRLSMLYSLYFLSYVSIPNLVIYQVKFYYIINSYSSTNSSMLWQVCHKQKNPGAMKHINVHDSRTILSQNHPVIKDFFTACNIEFFQKVFNCKLFLFFTSYIKDYFSILHHNKSVAMSNGILHIMCNH